MNPFEMLDLVRRTHPDSYWRARIGNYLATHHYKMKDGAANEWRNPPAVPTIPTEGEN